MTNQHWQNLLDHEHANWELRLGYSDWLEEQGDDLAASLQRWMVKHERHCMVCSGGSPRHSSSLAGEIGPHWVGEEWCWDIEEVDSPLWYHPLYEPGLIPKELNKKIISLYPNPDSFSSYENASRQEAEEKLLGAWKAISEEHREYLIHKWQRSWLETYQEIQEACRKLSRDLTSVSRT